MAFGSWFKKLKDGNKIDTSKIEAKPYTPSVDEMRKKIERFNDDNSFLDKYRFNK